MIIEPTSINPRSRRGRAIRLLGIGLPIVLLVAVVGGGVLGRSATPPAPAPTEVVAATAVPAASVAPQPVILVLGGPPAYPSVVDGLVVHSITEAMDILAAGGQGQVLAVKGNLGLLVEAGTCVDRTGGALGPLCERRGVLTEAPWVTDGAGAVQMLSTHLHPRFPVGVRLPYDAARATSDASGQIRVVVVGRFEGGGDACRPVGPVCGPGFEVDSVAWEEGAPFPLSLVVDAGIDPSPWWFLSQQDLAETAAIGTSGTILFEALLRPETIARVDPVAAAAIAKRTSGSGLVWYVRGLQNRYDQLPFPIDELPPSFLTWVVLDNTSGAVLARSPTATG